MSAASGKTADRSLPEWVTFIVAALVIVVVAALLVVQAFGSFDPPSPTAVRAGDVRVDNGTWFVPVDVTNHGDETAAQVEVVAELAIGDEVVSGGQTVDFLGGGEVAHLTFAFDVDPAAGELTVRVGGFAEP